jgi:hypothetical protein
MLVDAANQQFCSGTGPQSSERGIDSVSRRMILACSLFAAAEPLPRARLYVSRGAWGSSRCRCAAPGRQLF